MKKIAGVRYKGGEPCPVVRDGEPAIKPGVVITAPDDVLAYLASRADFEVIEADGDPAASPDAPKKE